MQRIGYNPYEKAKKDTLSGIDIELAVLEKASAMLTRCQENWSDNSFNRALDDALRYNQKIWDVLQSDWRSTECLLSRQLRENLLSLGVFIRKSTLDIMAFPRKEKLNALIGINENLINGLRAQKSANIGKA
jgi:flagellar biosynthesis activator protein FlaF